MTSRREVSSGAIVYKISSTGVFVAFVRDSVGKMTFPKGHVERRETIERTARREAGEEIGLFNLRLVRKLGKIRISFIDRFVKKGHMVVKDIHYFLFEAPADAKLKRPEKKQGEPIRGVRWVPLADAPHLSEYEDMVDIVRRALELIKRQVVKRGQGKGDRGQSQHV